MNEDTSRGHHGTHSWAAAASASSSSVGNSAVLAGSNTIPADTDISKEKYKSRLTFFAPPKSPVRARPFACSDNSDKTNSSNRTQPLDASDTSDGRTSLASNLDFVGNSFHSGGGSRTRSNFEVAVANLQQQQQQQERLHQQHHQYQSAAYDEQLKLEGKKSMDGHRTQGSEVHLEDGKHVDAMSHGQETVPEVRNWLKDMGGDDLPLMSLAAAAPPAPTPQVEYDTTGRIVKSKSNLAALGDSAPGAYSAGPGMQQLLNTPENYGQLGVIGPGSTRSWKEEKSSREFRKSLTISGDQSAKHNDTKLFGVVEEFAEEGLGKDGKGDPANVEGNLQPTKATWWKKKPVMLVMLLVVISAVVVVPIVIVLQSNSSSESETVEQQQQQKQETDQEPIKEEWVPLVPNMTNATLAALEDPFLLQSLAYEWIAKDPDWDTYEDWRKQQRFAMMCFYYGYSGDPSYLSQRFSPTLSRHECEWIRALDTCEGSDRGAITKIGAISPYQLSFTRFTPEIGFLTHLEEIDFSLGLHMKHLEDLFPLDVIKSLPPIKSLKVDRCELGGSIPSTLGLITSLTSLDLPGTGLAFTIPSQLGLLSDLETLTLSSNALTGSIPKEIGELPSLKNFDIRNNLDLESPIPSGFCMDGRAPLESLITDWCFSPSECCGA